MFENDDESTSEEQARAAAFLRDLVAVCREHGLSLTHEDCHGAFLVEPFKERYAKWLLAAAIDGPLEPVTA